MKTFFFLHTDAILLLGDPVRRAPLIAPRGGGDGPESKSETPERRSAHDRHLQGYGGGLVGSIAGQRWTAGRAFGMIELHYLRRKTPCNSVKRMCLLIKLFFQFDSMCEIL
ncbi:hypothetical protein NPIL_35091 [Nephila pilipes]|uniref:Uncharacterized protein n=1 Tax=Nephila pilipes TaxID=299642 RepID=A0A8X6TY22_NEPPI|nr:hypothetical protein NPIL_35091 [Nephila pilipes]